MVLSSVEWRKSSNIDTTDGACVEPAATEASIVAEWRKSSRSTNTGGQCVEVADLVAAVAVRDSKDPDGPKLIFGPAAWKDLATRVKQGTLDLG